MTDKQLAAFKTWMDLWGQHRMFSRDAERIADLAPLVVARLEKAEQERDEAIRLGDERLAEVYDEKTACVKQLRHERDSAREEAKVLRIRIRENSDDCEQLLAEAQTDMNVLRKEVNQYAKERDAALSLLEAYQAENRTESDLRTQLLQEMEAHAETKWQRDMYKRMAESVEVKP